MEVSNSSGSSEQADSGADPPERLDLELLMMGKRMGLSFDEMNMFRVRDLLKFIYIYAGEKDDQNTVRQAGQADFDAF